MQDAVAHMIYVDKTNYRVFVSLTHTKNFNKLKILKNSESCARRKKFNKFTECWLGFYKCATDQNPKIIESNYLDAISNCAQFVELSAITQVGVPPRPSPWDSLKILSIKSDS